MQRAPPAPLPSRSPSESPVASVLGEHHHMSLDPFFGASADSLQFLDAEPGDDQRWSTWPTTSPTERGPLPHPDWLVTSAAAFDTELGIVKTGKEADVFLLERAIPGQDGCTLAAKRYRGAGRTDF